MFDYKSVIFYIELINKMHWRNKPMSFFKIFFKGLKEIKSIIFVSSSGRRLLEEDCLRV